MPQELKVLTLASEDPTVRPRLRQAALVWLAMRPHQWTKNLFILAPLLFGKRATDLAAVINSLIAFTSFCALSSSLYIVNDWVDAESDRMHPEKRTRPISSGELPVSTALAVALALAIVSLSLSWVVGATLVVVAIGYAILMIAYSYVIKHVPILDCMTIAAGFVLRVVGGSIAVGVMATHWLIVCAFLLALFLAFTKRRQELLTLVDDATGHRRVLEEYTVRYLDQVNNILTAAVIVCYALYTIAPETVDRFGTNKLIYGTVFVAYGVLRYLLLIEKPANGGNPTKLLLRDKPMLLAIIGWCAYNAIVIYQATLLSSGLELPQ